MKLLILPVLAAILVQGCATPQWTADKIADGVNVYCDRLTEFERAVMRARINLQTHPNTVRVDCYGDEP